MVSFFEVFRLKFSNNFLPLLCVLHGLPISFSFIWWAKNKPFRCVSNNICRISLLLYNLRQSGHRSLHEVKVGTTSMAIFNFLNRSALSSILGKWEWSQCQNKADCWHRKQYKNQTIYYALQRMYLMYLKRTVIIIIYIQNTDRNLQEIQLFDRRYRLITIVNHSCSPTHREHYCCSTR